jgi:hypothetical protein
MRTGSLVVTPPDLSPAEHAQGPSYVGPQPKRLRKLHTFTVQACGFLEVTIQLSRCTKPACRLQLAPRIAQGTKASRALLCVSSQRLHVGPQVCVLGASQERRSNSPLITG